MGLNGMSTGNSPVISRNGQVAALAGATSFGSTNRTLAVLDEIQGALRVSLGDRSVVDPRGMSVNDHGQVAFVSDPSASNEFIGVLNSRRSTQYSIVAQQGTLFGSIQFSSAGGVSINNLNEIAFSATDSTGFRGVFRTDVGSGSPIAVATSGEFVPGAGVGATFQSVAAINQHSMNDRGQIAFIANMRDEVGRSFYAVLRADPVVGVSPSNPILPDPPPPGSAPVWTMPVVVFPSLPGGVAGRPFTYYDPDLAVGYDYRISTGAPNFAAVQIPSPLTNGDEVFELSFGGQSYDLVAGEVFDFTSVVAEGVSSFRISGIDVAEGLDPLQPTAFVTGIVFIEGGLDGSTFTMTPIVVSVVPEPATPWMLLAGTVAGAGIIRRRL
jgi:hypothetical protein